MKVLIVDDEPRAIELLTSYLNHFSDFEIVGTFRNGLKALEFLNTNTVDVVFLDINMPHLSGLSLSKMIDSNTDIVFTTAYSEHALESYDVNALDYLLKPISLERFSKTITKLIDKHEKMNASSARSEQSADTIFVKSGTETHQIKIVDINYLQKDGNYMYYFVNDKKIMARQSIAEALEGLTENFIQIQKSYIVNFLKIGSVSTNHVVIGDKQLPIGAQFKTVLFNKLK
jgi:two-component system LytT family response regulator